MSILLDVRRLTVWSEQPNLAEPIVDNASFALEEGEVAAIIGESGAGKTTIARSISRNFSPTARLRVEGHIIYRGYDLMAIPDEFLRRLRRSEIRNVFQEPALSFSPVLTIGAVMRESLRALEDGGTGTSPADMLAQVGITRPKEVMRKYPHELSTGTLQRIFIAIAAASRPRLLIADEPTSSVDASERFKILDKLSALASGNASALLLVTHDLVLAQRYASKIIVITQGRIVEQAPTGFFFASPNHPYSRQLLEMSFRWRS